MQEVTEVGGEVEDVWEVGGGSLGGWSVGVWATEVERRAGGRPAQATRGG